MTRSIQIGKVAEKTGLSIDTILFYQKIGLVKQPARSEGGFRLFSETEIRDLVIQAQELGFSLTEIKQLSVRGCGRPIKPSRSINLWKLSCRKSSPPG